MAAVAFIHAPHFAAAAEIHVDPAGDDRNAGSSAESPLATPQGAREKARAIIARGLAGRVDMVFAEGVHTLGAPLELRPEDSGTAEFPVTWKAASGARVVWSGGLAIPKAWREGQGGIPTSCRSGGSSTSGTP